MSGKKRRFKRHVAGQCTPSKCSWCMAALGSDDADIIPSHNKEFKTTMSQPYKPPTQPFAQTAWSGTGGSNYHKHVGERLVFTWQGRAFYGSSSYPYKVEDWPVADFHIDLATNLQLPSDYTATPIKKQLLKSVTGPDKAINEALMAVLAPLAESVTKPKKMPFAMPRGVRLDWADQSAPFGVTIAFWQALLNALPEGTAEEPAKVIVSCQGGHGRTGTALAALLITASEGQYGASDAARIVRSTHCKQSIESKSQMDYLLDLAFETDKWTWEGNPIVQEEAPLPKEDGAPSPVELGEELPPEPPKSVGSVSPLPAGGSLTVIHKVEGQDAVLKSLPQATQDKIDALIWHDGGCKHQRGPYPCAQCRSKALIEGWTLGIGGTLVAPKAEGSVTQPAYRPDSQPICTCHYRPPMFCQVIEHRPTDVTEPWDDIYANAGA